MKMKNQFKIKTYFLLKLFIIISIFNLKTVKSEQIQNTTNQINQTNLIKQNQSKYFVKNVGQLSDDFIKNIDIHSYYKQNPQNILYYSRNHNFDIYIKKTGFVVRYKTFNGESKKNNLSNENNLLDKNSFEDLNKIKYHENHTIEYYFSNTTFSKCILTDKISDDLRIIDSMKALKPEVIEFKNNDYENIYIGNKSESHYTNIKTLNSIIIKNIYENIDIRYYFNANGDFEYDFILHPNSDYKKIQLNIKYADNNFLNENGEITAITKLGDFISEKPSSYIINESELAELYSFGSLTKKVDNFSELKTKYNLIKNEFNTTNPHLLKSQSNNLNNGQDNYYKFEIENYDNSKITILDPITNINSTYYGGTEQDYILSITSDENGNYYATGFTGSSNSISLNGYQNSFGGLEDIFVVKFNNKFQREWATYIGGERFESGFSIKAKNGKVYIVGETSSQNIPITNNAHQKTISVDIYDAYLAILKSDGSLEYATYYGGDGSDKFNAVDIDANGLIYAAGFTQSANNIFADGYQDKLSAKTDGMIVRFNQNGVRLWGTYFGGDEFDYINDLHLDKQGNIIIAGSTNSTNLKMLNAIQSTKNNGYDTFISRFSTSGNLLTSTYYGGNGSDFGNSITSILENQKLMIYLAGSTYSTDFPTTPNTHKTQKSDNKLDAFVIKFNENINIEKCTYFGGDNGDFGQSITTNNNNQIILAGATQSYDKISTADAYQKDFSDVTDAYVSIFDTNLKQTYGTYFGGFDVDEGRTVCYNSQLDAIQLGGVTTSRNNINLNGHQSTIGGNNDGFIVTLGDLGISIDNDKISELCFQTKMLINYTTFGNFNNDNLFDIQLSDENGNFASPYTLRKVTNKDAVNLEVNLPNNLKFGTKYRIRVISSSPYFVSTLSKEFTIYPKLNLNSLTRSNSTCINSNVTYKYPQLPNTTYRWDIQNAFNISGSNTNEVNLNWNKSGQNYVKLTVTRNASNCSDTVSFFENVIKIEDNLVLDNTPEQLKKDTFCIGQVAYYKLDKPTNNRVTWRTDFDNGDINIIDKYNIQVLWKVAGMNSISATEFDSVNNCARGFSRSVLVNEMPNGSIIGQVKSCFECEENYVFNSKNKNLKLDWKIDNEFADIVNIQGNQITIKYKKVGNTKLRLDITDTITNCTNYYEMNLTLTKEIPLTMIADTLLCENTEFTYTTIDRDYFEFMWEIDGDFEYINSSKNSKTILWKSEQIAVIKLKRLNKENNQEEEISFIIRIVENPKAEFETIGEYCLNEFITINTKEYNQSYTYRYKVDALENQTDFIRSIDTHKDIIKLGFNQKGKYLITLNITNENDCSLELIDTIIVKLNPEKPVLTFKDNTLSTNALANKYTWYIDNKEISTTTIGSLQVSEDGNYSVKIENEFGCESERSENFYVNLSSVKSNEYEPTFILSEKETEIILTYQNPNISDLCLKMTDIFGREINFNFITQSNEIIILKENIGSNAYINANEVLFLIVNYKFNNQEMNSYFKFLK